MQQFDRVSLLGFYFYKRKLAQGNNLNWQSVILSAGLHTAPHGINKLGIVGGGGNKPPISVQQQNGHIQGTPQWKNRVKFNVETSIWEVDPVEASRLTWEAWDKGIPSGKSGNEKKFGMSDIGSALLTVSPKVA